MFLLTGNGSYLIYLLDTCSGLILSCSLFSERVLILLRKVVNYGKGFLKFVINIKQNKIKHYGTEFPGIGNILYVLRRVASSVSIEGGIQRH